MHLQQVIQHTLDLMAINSHQTQGKHEIIEWVHQLLTQQTDAKVTINTDIEPALIAKLKGTNSNYKLMLQGHLDVVSAPTQMFIPKQENGIIYGRGAADMKAGCACIISAFIQAATEQHKLQNDLLLVLTTDEETTGATIKHLLANNLLEKPNFAIIPEPTNLHICNAHKGESWLNVEFFGKSAHSSLPELGVNAIYMASDFIQALRLHSKSYPKHEQYGKESISIGAIEGGTDINIVPDYAKVRIDKRYLPHQNQNHCVQEIEKIIAKCQAVDATFCAKLNIEGDWSALYTNPDSEDFQLIHNTINQSLNIKTDLIFWNAWGEGGYINQFNIPTIYFGAGQTELAHTANEQINTNDIERACHAYYQIIHTLCY